MVAPTRKPSDTVTFEDALLLCWGLGCGVEVGSPLELPQALKQMSSPQLRSPGTSKVSGVFMLNLLSYSVKENLQKR